jgi:hypothetical protein
MTSHNGPAPDTAEAQLLALLGQTVDELQARYDALKTELADVTARLSRYRKMQGPAAPAKRTRSPQGQTAKVPSVSLERQELILTAIRDAGEPIIASDVAKRLGISRYSADTGIAALRERDLIRFAGKGGKTGNANAWAAFPEAEAD